MMNDESMKGTTALPEPSAKKRWQWRPMRWKVALIILAIVLTVGSNIIFFATGTPLDKGGKEPDFVLAYNFNLIIFLLFVAWTAYTDREWPVWKRLLWMIVLWIMHGFMQILPFSIIVDRLTGGFVTNPTTVSILLAFVSMRRSSFFVEPATAELIEKEMPARHADLPGEDLIFQSSDGQEEKIDLFALGNLLWKRRKMISWISGVMVVMTAVSSLFMPNIYEAKAVIIPVQRDKDMASTLMGNLYNMMGAPYTSASGELVLLLQSNILREKIIQDYQLMPVLFKRLWDEEKKDWKASKFSNAGGRKKIRQDDEFTLNSHSIFFKAIIPYMPDDKPILQKDKGIPDIWDGLRELETKIKIEENKFDQTIVVSAEADDPVRAANMVMYFLTALNDYMSNDAKRVAAINKKYLEEQLMKTADPLIKQKIYNLIAQQVETSMMADVKENYFFKIIDPPKAPDKKIKPRRALMVVSSFLVSLVLGIGTVFVLELWKKIEQRKAAQIRKLKVRPEI
ncbi:MAG: hypothetical protein KBA28_13430 [Syntrophaceae bacterium]|jgi:LPS O-antigen subunit length determinant protein (WzzB/FepE family)|nr:hypothetical protein [Syntrophaceae bacterium]